MDISVAMKLIDLGFTTEQIKAFETPVASNPEPSPVEPTAEAPAVEEQPSQTVPVAEPIDYKKLAEEVALYNQRNAIVPPEEPKVTVTQPVAEPPKSAQEAILNFLG